jgi:Mg2+ and Co2+ transporter CorA
LVDCQTFNSANELNEIMKIFSVVSILFLPPATIGGFMGMNVLIPWQMVDLDESQSVAS